MTSLLLAVVMVFALAVPAFAAVYPDQAGSTLADMINAGNTEINGDQSLTGGRHSSSRHYAQEQ